MRLRTQVKILSILSNGMLVVTACGVVISLAGVYLIRGAVAALLSFAIFLATGVLCEIKKGELYTAWSRTKRSGKMLDDWSPEDDTIREIEDRPLVEEPFPVDEVCHRYMGTHNTTYDG